MLLSDISVKRPVFASVISLILVAFGLLAFDRLALREYPDIDAPVVSISTDYPGASASVVETRITQLIEDRISGLEGIRFISSESQDGRSDVNIEFDLTRNIDDAANDVRDRVARVLDALPDEADTPDVSKVDSNEDVIMWLNLSNESMTIPELTDYADRYLLDRFAIIDGVARVRIGGGQRFAMRIWIDRIKLAANSLTINDIEQALRNENVELPAGNVESEEQLLTVRVDRLFQTPEDFRKLVIKQGEDDSIVRLGDIAKVEKGTTESRVLFRGNGEPMVGLGITKQSTANTIDVARAAKAEAARLNAQLPDGMKIHQSYDSSIFIEEAISEVYKTLAVSIGLVVLVIYLFLGSARAMLVPAVTVPVSLISTFIVLMIMGYTINMLTLLALVLAIGLVVDDAIVVLENVVRRISEYKESPLVATYRGTRQVGFAVIATTLVLVAVFAPIAMLDGDMGRLFSEFAITICAAVVFSSIVALTLSPVIASKLLIQNEKHNFLTQAIDKALNKVRRGYKKSLLFSLRHIWVVTIGFFALLASSYIAYDHLPQEYTPKEDRGAFFVLINGPEGASYNYMEEYMNEIEQRLQYLDDSGEALRLLIRSPRRISDNVSSFNNGVAVLVLNSWGQRRSAFEIMGEVRAKLSDLPGVRAFPVMRQGIGSGIRKPVEFVIGGGTYAEIAQWRNILFEKIAENNPGFVGIDSDYKETSPQLRVKIHYDRAASLGVSAENIGTTLESFLASRQVTTFNENGEEYDVLVEGIRSQNNNAQDLSNIYVRSSKSQRLIPLANFVEFTEFADSRTLNRYNRVRSITIEANLADNLPLGEALAHLENLAEEYLPDTAIIDYKGRSRDFKFAGSSSVFLFGIGILIMFLVLAAQFESYVSPFIVTLSVPLALLGGLIGLIATNNTLNLYSQIGLLMLVGLAAKNGILIVEFANQLRDQGESIRDAVLASADTRLRPIIMTSITTAAGAVPLILSSGAGTETRAVVGITLFFGVLFATVLTLYIVPTAYYMLGRYTSSPNAIANRLHEEMGGDA